MYKGLETIRKGNTAQCVADIFEIHFPTAKTVLDCTAGAMRFWKWDHDLEITGIDIDPPIDDSRITVADYRNIPFETASFDVMTFDPPFLFSRGIQAVNGSKRFFMGAEAGNYESRRWSKEQITMPKNPAELLQQYRRIFEQRHIAKQGLICKGQNLVTGANRDYWSYNVMKLAEEVGMGLPTDILIQHSPAHRMADPRWKVQRKFRTAECYYLIYHHAKKT